MRKSLLNGLLASLALVAIGCAQENTKDSDVLAISEPIIGISEIPEIMDATLSQEEVDDQLGELDQLIEELAATDPDIFNETLSPQAAPALVVEICKACRPQSLKVSLNGKTILSGVKISTGKPGLGSTPSGTFRPGEMKVRRKSNFASRKARRPIYLEYAIQVNGGIFMHAASRAAQANTLGKPASHGCIRVDRRHIAQIYSLIGRYKKSCVIKIR